MSYVLTDFERSKKAFLRIGEQFLIGMFRDDQFNLKQGARERAFWSTGNSDRTLRNSEGLDYRELPNNLPKVVKARNFVKGTEEIKVGGILLDEEVEKLDDHDCPRIKVLLILKQMKTHVFARYTHCGKKLHFTVRNAREKFWWLDIPTIAAV